MGNPCLNLSWPLSRSNWHAALARFGTRANAAKGADMQRSHGLAHVQVQQRGQTCSAHTVWHTCKCGKGGRHAALTRFGTRASAAKGADMQRSHGLAHVQVRQRGQTCSARTVWHTCKCGKGGRHAALARFGTRASAAKGADCMSIPIPLIKLNKIDSRQNNNARLDLTELYKHMKYL